MDLPYPIHILFHPIYILFPLKEICLEITTPQYHYRAKGSLSEISMNTVLLDPVVQSAMQELTL